MSDSDLERPQIYLITPPELDLEVFPEKLAAVLDAVDVSCLRLSLASRDEDHIARVADALRDVAHKRDVITVIDRHVQLVERLGLDGVHLPDGGRLVRKLRKDLGQDVVIGAHCGSTRHEGINAAESGADYVSFGPVGPTALGDGTTAELELFQWWVEMIEVPVVAEGALTADLVSKIAPFTDFFAFGDEIWREENPVEALKAFEKLLG